MTRRQRDRLSVLAFTALACGYAIGFWWGMLT